jgi:hypothetical protein
MTVANLKSFHKIIIGTLLFSSCGSRDIARKYQAVVVIDKTSSIGFSKLDQLKQKLAINIEQTYALSTDIQLALLRITGNTEVIPEFDRFEEECPIDDGGRTYQTALLRWKTKKRKWIFEEMKQIDSLIDSACKNNTTDILSIFRGIQQAQKSHEPWDSINVYILSDMTNTSGHLNLLKIKSFDTAFNKGKMVCQDLIAQGQISTGNTEKLNLIIYTPGNMQNTNNVEGFWEGFFRQWGLKENQYQFERE